jgi:hypothetical protein
MSDIRRSDMDELNLALVMGSIHRVLKAEKILRREGLPVDTLVTPREVSADCGMVVAVRTADAGRALEILEKESVIPAEAWTLEAGKWRMLEGLPRR